MGGECIKPVAHPVHVNTVGYLPDGIKRATYRGGTGKFQIVRVADEEVVYEGVASELISSAETAESDLRVADFSEFAEMGEFRLRAEDSGESPPFRIGPDVAEEVVRVLMLGMYGQRCGTSVDFEYQGTTFSHDTCHLEDAWLNEYGAPEEKQVTLYGWHDAGDYGKYVNNGALTLANMLFAWIQYEPALSALELDIPESGQGGLPDYLHECKFQLDWLLSMQREDGGVADRVTTRSFDAMVRPEASTNPRFLAPVTTTATADFAAVVAQAARVFEPFDAQLAETYRNAAKKAWDYLVDNPTEINTSNEVRARFTGGYWSSDADDRLWAAAEIWETFGDADALAYFEKNGTNVTVPVNWDWPQLASLGVFTYLLSERPGRDPAVVERLTGALRSSVTAIVNQAMQHPYGRAVGDMYYWGINGVLARTTLNVGVLSALEPDPKLRDAIILQFDHLLGRNYYGRSYVTGLGHDPPYYPHHRPSAADSVPEPWPGLLIGGPLNKNNGMLPATTWSDSAGDFESNEVAINWNAAMIYAAAALLPAP